MQKAALIFGVFALFVACYSILNAAPRPDVSGNFTFTSFSTASSGRLTISSGTSTQVLATTTVKNRSFAELFNIGTTTVYCNVNGLPAATTTSFAIYASSSYKFTVDVPYQGAVQCINNGATTTTGTMFVLETGK